MTTTPMPWPAYEDHTIARLRDGVRVFYSDCEALEYERAMKEAALSRLRIAVEALSCLYPALALDLRYANYDDDKDALVSRVRGIEEALALCDLPNNNKEPA